MQEEKYTILGYYDLIKKFVSENKLRFVIFSLYFFGITRDYIYYRLNNINILEFSSLYDFLISPIPDFLLFALILTSIIVFTKKYPEKSDGHINEGEEEEHRKIKEITENLQLGFTLVLIIITGISFAVILIFILDLNWITIVSGLFTLIFLYGVGISIEKSDNHGFSFFYILLFAIYCIVSPFIQTNFVNLGNIEKNNFPKFSFVYENRLYRDHENLILLGSNSKYIFLLEQKNRKTLVIPKDEIKNLEFWKEPSDD